MFSDIFLSISLITTIAATASIEQKVDKILEVNFENLSGCVEKQTVTEQQGW